jgi:hypothetical protein
MSANLQRVNAVHYTLGETITRIPHFPMAWLNASSRLPLDCRLPLDSRLPLNSRLPFDRRSNKIRLRCTTVLT